MGRASSRMAWQARRPRPSGRNSGGWRAYPASTDGGSRRTDEVSEPSCRREPPRRLNVAGDPSPSWMGYAGPFRR